MKAIRFWTTPILFVLGICLTNGACGGGGSSMSSGPTITSVSVSPAGPTTVVIGQTQQYTASVQGTGAFSSQVSWFVNDVPGGNPTVGTISNTGVFTAPTTVPNPVGVTVKAVSTEDATKSGPAAVTVGTLNISGTVQTDGPLAGGMVTVSDVNPNDGSSGTTLASATTDASGIFTVMLTSVPAGAVRLTASGGTFMNEADGSTGNSATITESALLDSVTVPMNGVAITPLTEFVNSLTVGALTGTIPPARFLRGPKPNLTITFTGAHSNANALVTKFYGLTPTAQTETLPPKYKMGDITLNPDNFTVGLVISTLARAGKENSNISTTPDALIAALSKDFDDGKLDGKSSGTIMLGGAPLPPTTGTTDFLLATNDCAGSAFATASCASVTSNTISPSDVLPITRKIGSGTQSSTMCPRAFGLTPGSSAALATLSFDGHQYVFLAGRTKGIIVLDVTDPTNIPTPKAWTYLANVTFSINFVGGVVPVVGTASHPELLAYATALNHIALINAEVLATGKPGVDDLLLVDFETDIPITNAPVTFHDGSRVIAGGIPDNGRKGVWLATADGYEFFDLSTNALSSTVYPVDSGQQLAENVGGDINHNMIVAGNYLGMQLIGLSPATSLDMDSAYFNANIAPLASTLNENVSTNSVDSVLQVEVGTGVHVADSFFINLAALTNPTSSTFEPQPGAFASVQLAITPGTLDMTGASADPTSHLVLFGGDNTSWVAVGQLQDPATVPAGTPWAGMTDWIFTNADTVVSPSNSLDTYFSASDPPVFGRMYNQAVGKPFGYMLNADDTFLVQVDMQAFLDPTVTPRAGTSGDAAHQPLTDPATTGVLVSIAVP